MRETAMLLIFSIYLAIYGYSRSLAKRSGSGPYAALTAAAALILPDVIPSYRFRLWPDLQIVNHLPAVRMKGSVPDVSASPASGDMSGCRTDHAEQLSFSVCGNRAVKKRGTHYG